jgi:hypothetical protein
MISQSANVNLQEQSELISALVSAALSRSQTTLTQLLKQVVYIIPCQYPERLRGQITTNLLIQITRELEKSLGSSSHPTIAWFVVYVGLGSSPPEALQAVQMILEKDFKPFEDFFVDHQGIHFYNHGTTPERIQQIPERLSEFTQMRVKIDVSEVNQVIERFDLSEAEARDLLLNLKILEKKMDLPIEQLLSVLDYNDGLRQEVMRANLTSFDGKKGFEM